MWRNAARTARDVVVVGAGHNGLVAAALLARQGLSVEVVEEKDVVGGACKTEYPFRKAPELGHSTGAYLLGVMPPELIQALRLDLNILRRDPHYFLPTTGKRYLLFGSDEAAVERQFLAFFSEADWKADRAMQAEIGAIRQDLAPAFLQPPCSLEETAERFVRPALRQTVVELCRQPVSAYLQRFGFRSELLMAMYAATDGFSGLCGGWDTPGTGMNFLVHNMCRLPGSGGTWMVVEGGMGRVTQELARVTMEAGGDISTGHAVKHVLLDPAQQNVTGVLLENGREIRAPVVLVGSDPFRLRSLVPDDALSPDFHSRLNALRKTGRTLKVNLALKDLPRFRCLPDPHHGQHRTTTHLLPEEDTVLESLRAAHLASEQGRLPEFPAIEWYFHTPIDPTLQDSLGRHSSALFVQWVPYELAESSWDEQEVAFVQHLLSICDRFAPGTSDLVVDTFTLTPPKIEAHFGITGGHIHHVDNSFAFDERFPYRTPLAGLYSCSAGCHPAGSVMGCAGHNAATCILTDLKGAATK